MSDRSSLRLVVLGVLLFSLVGTLLGRLFFLQVVNADTYNRVGANNSIKDVITPAVRGLILDQAGRPLVANRSSLVVSIDRATLDKQKDKGKAVLTKLAVVLGKGYSYQLLWGKSRICGADKGAPRAPVCWNGSPFQPIPVAKDVPTAVALQIMERRSDYPGVLAQLQAVRQYPSVYGVNAAQILGYLGAVSPEQLAAEQAASGSGGAATLQNTDLVGKSGLEAQYDSQLRGQPGVTQLSVNISSQVTGTVKQTAPTPGNYLVTNIDARLQAVAEQQLVAAVNRARASTDPTTKKKYVADSGAVVVLDVTNGHVLAMASYPKYDPKIFVGGVSTAEYEALTAPAANFPLISRVTQGLFAPASTFKIATTSAALMNGYSGDQKLDCTSSVTAGGRVFRNNEGASHGPITFAQAIQFSCDTVYYDVAKNFWLRSGGLNAGPNTLDPVEKMALAYGLGRKTGIDLPSESAGKVGGRRYRAEFAARYRADWCRNKDNPKFSAYQRAIWTEHCQTGDPFQVGDAVNLAIGQGDTAVTPLQMAQAYAALANGGVIFQPEIAKAVISPTGKVVSTIAPKRTGQLPVSQQVQTYLRNAFESTTTGGTAASAFTGFPFAAVGGIGSKTGTGQVVGKQSTSWFASYAPANKPRYAVVMMVSQGGYGVTTSGPSVRKIYEAIFGIKGSTVNPADSVLAGGAPETKLPTVTANGTPIYPAVPVAPAVGAATPASGVTGAFAVPFGAAVALIGRRRRRAERVGRRSLRDDWHRRRGSP